MRRGAAPVKPRAGNGILGKYQRNSQELLPVLAWNSVSFLAIRAVLVTFSALSKRFWLWPRCKTYHAVLGRGVENVQKTQSPPKPLLGASRSGVGLDGAHLL